LEAKVENFPWIQERPAPGSGLNWQREVQAKKGGEKDYKTIYREIHPR